MSSTAPDRDDPRWQRRPIRSLVVELARLVGGAVLLALVILRRRLDEWLTGEGSDLGTVSTIMLIVLTVGFVFLMTVSIISWRTFSFAVTESGLHTYDGGLNLTYSSYPLERIDGVDLQEPLIFRLAGLATVVVEVSGGGDSQAEIEGIPRAQAKALQRELLALRNAQQDRTEPHQIGQTSSLAGDTEHRDSLILAFGPDRAKQFVLLSPVVWLVPTIAVAVLALTIFQWVDKGFEAAAGTLIGIIIGLVLAGAIGAFFSNVIERWSQVATWELRSRGSDLVIVRGKLNRVRTTIRQGKVSAILLGQGPIRRRNDWWTVSISVAAFGTSLTGDESDGTISAAATTDEVLLLLPHLMPNLTEESRSEIRAAMLARAAPRHWMRPPERARWLMPLTVRFIGIDLQPQHVLIRTGRWHRSFTMIDRQRIQVCSIECGPLARVIDVADVEIEMPSGPTKRTTIPALDSAAAHHLFERLAINMPRE